MVKRLFGKLHLGELETIVGGIELGLTLFLLMKYPHAIWRRISFKHRLER